MGTKRHIGIVTDNSKFDTGTRNRTLGGTTITRGTQIHVMSKRMIDNIISTSKGVLVGLWTIGSCPSLTSGWTARSGDTLGRRWAVDVSHASPLGPMDAIRPHRAASTPMAGDQTTGAATSADADIALDSTRTGLVRPNDDSVGLRHIRTLGLTVHGNRLGVSANGVTSTLVGRTRRSLRDG